jgi:uracil-DNA glycosylase
LASCRRRATQKEEPGRAGIGAGIEVTEHGQDPALQALLALQIEWGADEALDPMPHDRRRGLAALADPPRSPPPAARVAASTPADIAPGRLASPPATGQPGTSQPGRAAALAEAADSLATLRQALEGFSELALRQTAGHLVFATGQPGCDVAIVGEAPDADEDRSGTPFSGGNGALLDRMLAGIGLQRDGLALLPAIPWRPPGGRPPNAQEIATCLPFLHRQLALLAPRRLVLMGALPLRMLTGESGIARQRGRWRDITLPGLGAVPGLPMRHPGYLLTHPAARREAWIDLLMLRQALFPG